MRQQRRKEERKCREREACRSRALASVAQGDSLLLQREREREEVRASDEQKAVREKGTGAETVAVPGGAAVTGTGTGSAGSGQSDDEGSKKCPDTDGGSLSLPFFRPTTVFFFPSLAPLSTLLFPLSLVALFPQRNQEIGQKKRKQFCCWSAFSSVLLPSARARLASCHIENGRRRLFPLITTTMAVRQ